MLQWLSSFLRLFQDLIFFVGTCVQYIVYNRGLQIYTFWNFYFFGQKVNMGIKNAEFYADFKFVGADFQKVISKKPWKMCKSENTPNFRLQFCAFFYTHLDIFAQKIFWGVMIAQQTLNANAKKLYIFKHF